MFAQRFLQTCSARPLVPAVYVPPMRSLAVVVSRPPTLKENLEWMNQQMQRVNEIKPLDATGLGSAMNDAQKLEQGNAYFC